MPIGDCVSEAFLEKDSESNQSLGESHGSFSDPVEIVPQTMEEEAVSFLEEDDIETEVLWEERLVEARVSWDLAKTLGLSVSNEKAMVAAIAKVQDCQDFILPRRRGHPRKAKNRNRD